MPATKLEVVSNNGSKKNVVYSSVRRFSQEGLSDLIRVLMENVDDSLFELSDKVENDHERNMYFEAMREIRLKRDGIKQRFNDEMKLSFDRVLNGENATTEVEQEEELTLLELDDLEDNIAIGNMVSRARPRFEDELFALSERLKLVLNRKSFVDDENPLDPRAICESFHNASDLLETDIQVKLIFYKLFERYVINNLGHFYKEVNDLFVENGVLPGFKADQERMKQTTRFMANRIRQSGHPSAFESSPSVMPAGTVMTEPAPGAEGNLFATLQQALAVAAPAAPGPVTGAVPGAGAGIVPGAVPGAAGPTPGLIPGAASGGVPEAPTGMPGEPVAAVDFVTALTQLQTQQPVQNLSVATDPQNLREATHQQLTNFREQHQGEVNGVDGQTIDVVSMLFDFFFDDEALPAPIKVLIGRLQIPMLKVAILDKDFFNQKKHPARKLLDAISRASLGWTDNHEDNQRLIDKTEEIVNFLVAEFDQDIGVFEEAYIDFENFLRQEQAASDKAVEALQQQEKQKDQQIEAARKAAENLVARLVRSRELSFEVIDFLETTWTSVLFNAYLSLGESSNHWRNLKRISTTFVWTLIPKDSEQDRAKIIKTIPPLLRALSKGMDLVHIKTEVQNRIFKMLAGEHARIVKLTSKNIVTRVDDETIWPEDGGAAAFAKAQGIDPTRAPDLEFTTDVEGEIEVVDNDTADDSITVIDLTSTSEVIEDLDQFSADVKGGQIQVEEEIVMESENPEDFELIEQDEDFVAQAKNLEIGSWVEFEMENNRSLAARLSWKSNVTGNLVFVNRQGHKVRNFTVNGFAMELRSGRANPIESSSVFDRAIYTIMSKVQQ